jgi:hypothetical protein
MTTYHLRTTDSAALLALGVQIGLLVERDGVHGLADPHAGIWDVIGPIYRPTGAVTETDLGPVPVIEPITDAGGQPYWHANLMLYTASLTEMAQAAYAADPTPELAQALTDISTYFVTDASGEPVAPGQPARVFG